MRTLHPINSNAIEEYELIANSKREARKLTLLSLKPIIEEKYNYYFDSFETIESYISHNFSHNEKNSLLHCYNSSTKSICFLKSKIRNKQIPEFQSTCPYCLISTPSTFDHYIPKEHFPEFCILPHNLFPCCSVCNGLKLAYWKEGNSRKILHFYNDNLSIDQFLFVSIQIINLIPTVNFFLNRTVNNIDPDLFKIIEGHFMRLDLINRYKSEINTTISDIKIDVASTRRVCNLSPEDIKTVCLEKSIKYGEIYGKNYWKAVLIQEIANSDEFIQLLLRRDFRDIHE